MALSQAEQLVQEASERGVILTLAVAELKPRRVLEILAEGGHSHRVSIQTSDGSITIEIGNGLVVGAEAALEGETLSGRDAYVLLRRLEEGSLRIEPLRFPSLANILQPVAELPDFMDSIPPPMGADTIELTLPEARPVHRPDPTSIDIELLEDDLACESAVIPAPPRAAFVTIPAPPPEMSIQPPVLDRLEATERAARRPSIPVIAAAATLLLVGVGAGTLALGASQGVDPAPAPAPVATAPVMETIVPEEELPAEVDLDLSEDEVNRHAARLEARQLARTARAQIRRGQRAEALVTARRAADLRGGLPFYQVLLGDALVANGQRAAARRAYRRALRLRPGYAPATRRLERRSATARRARRGART